MDDSSNENQRKEPRAEDDIAAFSEHHRDRFRNQEWPTEYISMTHGNPDRQPFDPGVLYAQKELERKDVMGHYFGAGLLYGGCIDKYNQYMHDIGIMAELSGANYVPTNGGTHAYNLAVEQLLGKDDILLVPTPTYGFFIDPRNLKHTHVEAVQLRAEDGYKLTPELLDNAITRINKKYAEQGSKCRVTAFLNINPTNPTGVVYTKDELTPLAEILKKHDIKLVIDDLAYLGAEHGYNKNGNNSKFAAPMASIDGMFERTLSLFSLSKAYSLTALRSGLVVGPERFVQPLRYEISRRSEFLPNSSQVAMFAVFTEPEARAKYVTKQAEEFEFKYNLIRVLINGWNHDLTARSFFQKQGIFDQQSLATHLYPSKAIHLRKLDLEGKYHRVDFDAVDSFGTWLNEIKGYNNKEVGFILTTIMRLMRYFNRTDFALDKPDSFLADYNTKQKELNKSLKLAYKYNDYVDYTYVNKEIDITNISAKREKLVHMLNHPCEPLKVLPITKAGFFATVDATALKGERAWSQLLEDAGDISKETAEKSGVSLLAGEAMGNHDGRLLLRLTFSDEPLKLIEGVKRIRHFLSRINTIPDDTMTTLETMKRGGPEQQSATEKYLAEKFGGTGNSYHKSRI